jgi:predicted HicB family RNase H-like nuclease
MGARSGTIRSVSDEGEPKVRTPVRLPKALHEQLVDEARRRGMSLNELMVLLLAGGVGFKLTDR